MPSSARDGRLGGGSYLMVQHINYAYETKQKHAGNTQGFSLDFFLPKSTSHILNTPKRAAPPNPC